MSDEETAPEMLSRLGADGMLWAQEFNKTAVRLGYLEMDEGWLVGWFANAIENCDVIRCNPLRAENEKLRARILELEMFEQFAGEDNATIEKLQAENETHKEIAVRETMKNATLRAAFRVNMLRAYPHISHEEIDAEIAAALKETGE